MYRFSRVHFVTVRARVSVGFVLSVIRLDVALRLASVGVICGVRLSGFVCLPLSSFGNGRHLIVRFYFDSNGTGGGSEFP